MRILIVHNHYGDYAFGGEGLSANTEADLLRSNGHAVLVYERTNAELLERPLRGKLRAFWNIPWSPEGYDAVSAVLDKFKPDLMHVNNYRYLLSPSVLAAAKDRGVATVFSLRNYQLACPASQFLWKRKVCEDCLDGFPFRILWRQCTEQGFVNNLAHLYLYLGVRKRGFLAKWVDAYIALTEFARAKFIEAGVPADKVHVKPNFLNDSFETVRGETSQKKQAVFVGRLSREKGVDVMINAWKPLTFPLVVVGDGPERSKLEATAPSSVRFVGALPHEEVLKEIAASKFLVFPSILYEGFGRTIVEAMAMGKAVVASDLGGRRELVRDGDTGRLVKAGDASDMRRKVQWMIEHPQECTLMGKRGRKLFLDRYTPDRNYRELMAIYDKAMASNRAQSQSNN